MFEGAIDYLGETLCPTWNISSSRPNKAASRQPLAERHKAVRRLLNLDNGNKEYDDIRAIVDGFPTFAILLPTRRFSNRRSRIVSPTTWLRLLTSRGKLRLTLRLYRAISAPLKRTQSGCSTRLRIAWKACWNADGMSGSRSILTLLIYTSKPRISEASFTRHRIPPLTTSQ